MTVEQAERWAFERWRRGEVVPARITLALDDSDMEGALVDEACLAKEPDVDRWEEGKQYPRWDQLRALAELTGFELASFFIPAKVGRACCGKHAKHFPPEPPAKYPSDVVARCPGTDASPELPLF